MMWLETFVVSVSTFVIRSSNCCLGTNSAGGVSTTGVGSAFPSGSLCFFKPNIRLLLFKLLGELSTQPRVPLPLSHERGRCVYIAFLDCILDLRDQLRFLPLAPLDERLDGDGFLQEALDPRFHCWPPLPCSGGCGSCGCCGAPGGPCGCCMPPPSIWPIGEAISWLTPWRAARSACCRPTIESNSCSMSMMKASGSRTWSRSEERRVGKECRSRWSPYH